MKNRKRALSLLLSLVLVLGLAVPAMAAEENYFTRKGLKVQQEPPTGSIPFTFAIYDNTVERKDAAYSLEQGDFYVESCTVAPADKAGYQTITLKVRGEMFLVDEAGTELLGCGWSTGLYDYYTGVRFVMKNLQGNTSEGGSADVSYGGTTYPVTYQAENSWEQGEWVADSVLDKAVSSFDCHQTVTVTAPVGYDGLVLAVMNKTSALSEELDPSKTYYADGENVVTYFRFGPKAVPDTPAEPGANPAAPSGAQTSKWAEAQVNAAIAKGLVPEGGLGDDYRVSITRAQFAATAVKLYEVMSGEKISPAANNLFTDTSDPDVLRAAAAGFVNGVTDTTFAPDALVTREQAATLLSRVYTKLGGEIPQVSNTSFADDTSVSGYAKSAVAFMADKDIVSGVGDNQFNAKGSASIEQALIIALRMLDNLK